jgi:hypothetical protein
MPVIELEGARESLGCDGGGSNLAARVSELVLQVRQRHRGGGQPRDEQQVARGRNVVLLVTENFAQSTLRTIPKNGASDCLCGCNHADAR